MTRAYNFFWCWKYSNVLVFSISLLLGDFWIYFSIKMSHIILTFSVTRCTVIQVLYLSFMCKVSKIISLFLTFIDILKLGLIFDCVYVIWRLLMSVWNVMFLWKYRRSSSSSDPNSQCHVFGYCIYFDMKTPVFHNWPS